MRRVQDLFMDLFHNEYETSEAMFNLYNPLIGLGGKMQFGFNETPIDTSNVTPFAEGVGFIGPKGDRTVYVE